MVRGHCVPVVLRCTALCRVSLPMRGRWAVVLVVGTLLGVSRTRAAPAEGSGRALDPCNAATDPVDCISRHTNKVRWLLARAFLLSRPLRSGLLSRPPRTALTHCGCETRHSSSERVETLACVWSATSEALRTLGFESCASVSGASPSHTRRAASSGQPITTSANIWPCHNMPHAGQCGRRHAALGFGCWRSSIAVLGCWVRAAT